MPKRRIISTILRRVITQKSYNVSFIVTKALDHVSVLVYDVWNRFLFRPCPSAVFKIKLKAPCFGNLVVRRP